MFIMSLCTAINHVVMHSDKQLYQIFEVNPQWLFELTGRPSPGPCKFVSVTLKAIERRTDGMLLPDLLDKPITVAELQMQADSDIYQRVVIEMALLQVEHPGRAIEGMILFASRDLDPRTAPWAGIVASYYLDELLVKLAEQSPDHPLVAVFQPLLEPDENKLELRAAQYYNQITIYSANDRQRARLQEVFVDWLLQRFAQRGKQEIEQMLYGQLPDLRDTQAGKDLIAIGKTQGLEQGLQAGREQGREAGLEQGLEAGEIRLIRTLQSILREPESTDEELAGMNLQQLRSLAESLQTRIMKR